MKKGAIISPENGGGFIVKGKVFYENSPKEEGAAFSEIIAGKTRLEFRGLSTPGTYRIYTTLAERAGAHVGREASALFTIHGVKVTILNSMLNKDVYQKGETALATFAVDVVATNLASTTPLTIATDISGKNGVCANSAPQDLSSTAMKMMVPITTDCEDPTLFIKVTNQDGVILASSTVAYKSTIRNEVLKNPSPSATSRERIIYSVTGAFGFLVGLFSVVIVRRKYSASA
jgi:hypothetical protein